MGLVTAYCPLTGTGDGETGVQTADETRFVADCNVNPAALVGQVKIRFVPERSNVSCGASESLNTVPLPEMPATIPPADAVPFSVLSGKINPPTGFRPSPRSAKLYSVRK